MYPWMLALIVPVVFTVAQPLHAGYFQNGDFTSFAGWEGVIRDSATDLDEIVPDLEADSRFTLLGGGFGEISNDADYYEVALRQAFDLHASAQTLSFDFDWSLTPPGGTTLDLVQASLLDLTGNLLEDLFPESLDVGLSEPPAGFGPATTDVSAHAGQPVVVQFLLQDGDFDEQDWLRIGNIALSPAVPVPVPSTLALMCLGALGLGLWRRRLARGLMGGDSL